MAAEIAFVLRAKQPVGMRRAAADPGYDPGMLDPPVGIEQLRAHRADFGPQRLHRHRR